MTPEGWTEARLDQVVAFRRGVSWKKEQERKAPGPSRVPVLRIPNVKERLDLSDLLFVEGFTSDQVDRARVTRGWCVMVGSNGNPKRVGDCVPVDDPQDFVFASFLLGVGTTDENRLAARFMYRLLRSGWVQEDIAESVQGSTGLKNINLNRLRGLRVLLPPLGEQRKIAAILSSVDDAIEATQAVIDQLQVVKKAMMAELLTHGLPGRHTRFKMTEIGEIPEEWEVVRAESVFAEGPSNGRSPPSKASPPGVPTFSISAVRRGRVNIRDNVKYADGDVDGLRGALVRNGDILIVRGNGNPELVGRCGVVAEEPPDGCIYPDILMRVRPADALLPEFFVPLWNSPLVHDQVLDKAKTTNGTYKINGQDVRSILLPIPTKHEQRLIGDAVLAAEANSLSHADQLAGLQTLKSALMSVLLTGEVRVKPDEGAR